MKDIKDIIGRAVDSYGKAAAGTMAARKRFRYPIDSSTAAALLISEYKNTVEARGRNYLADDETTRRLQSVANWLTNPHCKSSVLLYGSLPGTGKTTTAAAIARMAKGLRNTFNPQTVFQQRCIEAGGKYMPLEEEEKSLLEMYEAAIIIPVFYTAGDLANMIESNRASFEAAKRCSFLIIDDMGTEPVSVKLYGNEFFPLIEILQHRYAEMLPTIITTNLELSRISDYYGPRILDRLREMCETLYYTQGESYRR